MDLFYLHFSVVLAFKMKRDIHFVSRKKKTDDEKHAESMIETRLRIAWKHNRAYLSSHCNRQRWWNTCPQRVKKMSSDGISRSWQMTQRIFILRATKVKAMRTNDSNLSVRVRVVCSPCDCPVSGWSRRSPKWFWKAKQAESRNTPRLEQLIFRCCCVAIVTSKRIWFLSKSKNAYIPR